jgi:predicted aspartyl protease
MAMNQGVISSRFPYIPIRFQVRLHTYEMEALVDTGFEGGIAVPPSLLENLGPPDGYELWAPVVGTPVLADVYYGSFQVDALGPFPVAITALGDEVLIGLEVIIRFIVTFDHGQRLVVEA